MLCKKSKVWWTSEDIASALALRSVSKKAYNYLRKVKKIPLPGISTLTHWTRDFKCLPGIQKDVLNVLEAKSKFMDTFSKLCVLCFDEMRLDSRISYDETEDRAYGPHTNFQVVMVRDLTSKWKQPIYYSFDQKITKEILFEILSVLHEAGFAVKAVVSDMGGSNQGLGKDLNIACKVLKQKENQSTSEIKVTTSFRHPSSNSNVWVFPDIPRLLKLFRNTFLDYGIKFSNCTVVYKDMIEAVIEEQELQMCPKLSGFHINVRQSARQKVKYAAQLF